MFKIRKKTDIDLLVMINKFNRLNEPINFTKASQQEGWDRLSVSKNMNKLIDLDLMRLDQVKVEGKWTTCFFATDSAQMVLAALDLQLCPHDDSKMRLRSQWGEVAFICPACGHSEVVT